MTPNELAQACKSLPLFPLPGAVLMPSSIMPLHVFEPRYTEMVANAMQEHKLIGIATIVSASHDDGAPVPVHPELGIGEIITHHELGGGRANIVLQFVASGRIRHEISSDTPYRIADVSVVDMNHTNEAQSAAELRMMLMQLGSISDEAAAETRRLMALDDIALTDTLAAKLYRNADEQRQYLAESRVSVRMDHVRDSLTSFLHATPHAAEA